MSLCVVLAYLGLFVYYAFMISGRNRDMFVFQSGLMAQGLVRSDLKDSGALGEDILSVGA